VQRTYIHKFTRTNEKTAPRDPYSKRRRFSRHCEPYIICDIFEAMINIDSILLSSSSIKYHAYSRIDDNAIFGNKIPFHVHQWRRKLYSAKPTSVLNCALKIRSMTQAAARQGRCQTDERFGERVYLFGRDDREKDDRNIETRTTTEHVSSI
jgi:hypothetical protein